MRAVGALVAMALLVNACSGGSTGSGADIAAQDPELVTLGGGLYEANCAQCHGSDLRGTDQGPSHLSEVYEPGHHTDQAFLMAVKFGSQAHHWPYGAMAPVPGLSDDDIAAITAFVREQQRLKGFEPYPPD